MRIKDKFKGKSPDNAAAEVPMNDIHAATAPPIGGATTTPHQQPNRATRRAEMTTTPETYVGAPDGEPALEALSAAPILITEQEVVFGTAAAVRARPTTMRSWTKATSVALAAVRRMFATPIPDTRQARRHYPKRYVFLEHSCMSREMDRL
jgi:hypothetical protein